MTHGSCTSTNDTGIESHQEIRLMTFVLAASGTMDEHGIFGPGVESLWTERGGGRDGAGRGRGRGGKGLRRKHAGRGRPRIGLTGRSNLPEDLAAKLGEAELHYVNGENTKAIELLSQVCRQAPKHPEPYNIMGLIYESSGDSLKALQLYILAATFTTTGAKSNIIDIWEKVATLAFEIGEWDQAYDAVLKCIKAKPSTDLSRMRILCLVHMQNMAAAKPRLVEFMRQYNGAQHLYFLVEFGDAVAQQGYADLALDAYIRYIICMLGAHSVNLDMLPASAVDVFRPASARSAIGSGNGGGGAGRNRKKRLGFDSIMTAPGAPSLYTSSIDAVATFSSSSSVAATGTARGVSGQEQYRVEGAGLHHSEVLEHLEQVYYALHQAVDLLLDMSPTLSAMQRGTSVAEAGVLSGCLGIGCGDIGGGSGDDYGVDVGVGGNSVVFPSYMPRVGPDTSLAAVLELVEFVSEYAQTLRATLPPEFGANPSARPTSSPNPSTTAATAAGARARIEPGTGHNGPGSGNGYGSSQDSMFDIPMNIATMYATAKLCLGREADIDAAHLVLKPVLQAVDSRSIFPQLLSLDPQVFSVTSTSSVTAADGVGSGPTSDDYDRHDIVNKLRESCAELGLDPEELLHDSADIARQLARAAAALFSAGTNLEISLLGFSLNCFDK